MFNPSIALQYRNPQAPAPDPAENMGKALSLRNMIQQGQMQAQQTEQLRQRNVANQRSLDEAQQFREAVAAGVKEDELLKRFPTLAPAALKANREQSEAAFKAKKAELDMAIAKSRRFGELAGTVTDDASYRHALGIGLQEGVLSQQEYSEALAQPWSDEVATRIRQNRDQALSVAEQLDQARKELDESRKKAEHDAKLPGVRADATKKELDLAGQAAAGVTTPQGMTTLRGAVSPAAQALMPAEHTPAAVQQLADMGMSAAQRSTRDNQAATRAETKRHHGALEGDRRARTAMAREKANRTGSTPAANQNAVRAIQNEHNDLHRKEQALHARATELGALLKQVNESDAPFGLYRDERGNVSAIGTAERKAAVKIEIRKLKDQAAELNKQKKEKLAQRERLQGRTVDLDSFLAKYGIE